MGRNGYTDRYKSMGRDKKKPSFRTAFDTILKIQLFYFYKLNIENQP